MSWSFGVKEKTAEDAIRVFNNKLLENGAYIPESVRNELSSAAHWLTVAAKEGYYVGVSTNGHVNADGTWYGGVNIVCTEKLPEEVPNVSGEVIESGRVGDAATLAAEDAQADADANAEHHADEPVIDGGKPSDPA